MSELNLRLLVYFEITKSGVALFPLMIGNKSLKSTFDITRTVTGDIRSTFITKSLI